MTHFAAEHLETLVAVVEEGSFERAALRLQITPSAVSQRMKALETACGRVLVRRSNPVTVTPGGEVLLRHAHQVTLLEADVTRELGVDAAIGERVRMPLAVNADSLATWFLPAVAGLGDDVGIALDLYRADQEHTMSLLRAGTVLAAVTSRREAIQGCTADALGVMRYRAVASSAFVDRHLGGGEYGDAPLGALARAPVVTFDRTDDLQEGFLRRHIGGGSTGPTAFIPGSDDFSRAVLLGVGWGLLPELQCATDLAAGRLRELAPAHPVDVPLYWQRWNLGSALLGAVSAAVLDGASATLRRVA